MDFEAPAAAPPQSRVAYVVERLKADVANGVIVPGELIKQTALAKKYGVSPTPVREALRMLQSDGVLTYSPHKGAMVPPRTPNMERELYRIRLAIEPAAVEMATEMMTDRGLASVRQAHRAFSEAIEGMEATPADLSRLNREFHLSICRQGSPLAMQHVDLIWARRTPGVTLFVRQDLAREIQSEHDLILEAIVRKDAAAAKQLSIEHIERAFSRRLQQLDDTDQDDNQAFA